MNQIRSIFLLLTLAPLASVADSGTVYWSIEIPTPEIAENILSDTNEKFYSKNVTFDVSDIEPDSIGSFYNSFFTEMGWADPSAALPSQFQRPGGWSGYSMRINESGQPEAAYGRMWKSVNPPAIGSLQLVLSNYTEAGFSGVVTVSITPEIDTNSLMQLNQLLGNDPKNLFNLFNAVGTNPFEIQNIVVPANFTNEEDPLLVEYFGIVNEVIEQYYEFGQKYVEQQ
ncbi:hypothetical protein [Umboniibacter marinipuniceus]|uniref:Uncharacterized protein n=1 Tax=Umboniibacter marinipuniceus TaxID=569599 RepID=A0A3M0A9G7_9GAMM|nr:hypothetical protein [Umboniibacter marinipuniceus]RMA80944.1 hypothetical protein DFR27_0733 [Umboniibacter marinipuniceus]